MVRIDDGTEVVGEEIAVEIGEGSVSPSGCAEPPPGNPNDRPRDRPRAAIRQVVAPDQAGLTAALKKT